MHTIIIIIHLRTIFKQFCNILLPNKHGTWRRMNHTAELHDYAMESIKYHKKKKKKEEEVKVILEFD